MKLLIAVVLLAGAAAVIPGSAAAQAIGTRSPGPVIADFGGVFDVPSPDFATPTDFTYRVVYEVAAEGATRAAVNPNLETAARFLNMHARAGVPLERMDLAVVVHGLAGKDLLDHEAYRKRYGIDNPNVALLEQLAAAGVDVILCGQTAASRGLPRAELAPQVRMALSAVTAPVYLQENGYRLIAF